MNSDPFEYGERFCVFRQRDSLYGVPAACVETVASGPKIVAVPQSGAMFAGICHFRSTFVPVLELAHITGQTAVSEPNDRQLLTLRGTGGTWGVLVDRVLGLEGLDVSRGRGEVFATDWNGTIIGSGTLRNEVVQIFNPSAVYQLAEQEIRQQRSLSSRAPVAPVPVPQSGPLEHV